MGTRKKSFRLPPFVPITKEMIKSEAFKSLTNAARVAYLLIKAQQRQFDQVDIKFPYSAAVPYMDRHTLSKAVKALEMHGFIEKRFEGGLYRRTNIYTLIDTWHIYKGCE